MDKDSTRWDKSFAVNLYKTNQQASSICKTPADWLIIIGTEIKIYDPVVIIL